MRKRWVWLLVGILALGACGGGGGENAEGSTERYCEATKKLDKASDELIDKDATTPGEIQAGFQKLMETHGDDLDDLVSAAPAEIRPEVAKGVDAFKKAAEGDFAAVIEFDDAKISEFEEKNCK